MKILGNITIPALLLFYFVLTGFSTKEEEHPQERTKLYGIFYHQPMGLDGSPYLHEEWQTGIIRLENGETAENSKIRLNIISNELVFYNEELLRIFRADKKTIKSFEIIHPGNKKQLFIKYTGEELGYRLKRNDLIEVLHQGKYSLYVKHIAEVIDSNDLNSRDKVYPKKYYFLQYENHIVEMKMRMSSLVKYFPENRKEIKKMAAMHHLRRQGEANIIRIIELINSDFERFYFKGYNNGAAMRTTTRKNDDTKSSSRVVV